MTGAPQASYEAVIAKLHRQYGQQIANLNQELAVVSAALDEVTQQQNNAQLVENTPLHVPRGFCEETDHDTKGDCLGPVAVGTARAFRWGKRPGERVNLCSSHWDQAGEDVQA